MNIKKVIAVGAACTFFVCWFLWMSHLNQSQDVPFKELHGKNSAQVKSLRGEPWLILTQDDSRYPVPNYGKPVRTNFAVCWIYRFKAKLAYVFFDSSGKVIDVFIAGG